MKVWKLQPIKATTHQGAVLIRADDEQRARQLAANLFNRKPSSRNTDSNEEDIYHPTEWNSFSWLDPAQVECRYESDDLSEKEGILSIR